MINRFTVPSKLHAAEARENAPVSGDRVSFPTSKSSASPIPATEAEERKKLIAATTAAIS